MKKILLFGIIIIGILIGCEKDPINEDNCYSGSNDPPRNSEKVTIPQGLWGDVWYWKGDFMPGNSTGEICQVERKILVYELTTMNDVEQVDYSAFYSSINTTLVASIDSDQNGFFQIKLESGMYSLFIEEGGNYYSNSFNEDGIFPVKIEDGKITEVRFDITHEATY